LYDEYGKALVFAKRAGAAAICSELKAFFASRSTAFRIFLIAPRSGENNKSPKL
jgi:hypothetical protein